MKQTIRLTMSQALVKFLIAQKVEMDGDIHPLFSGVWAIFGHGNVAGLGEALYNVKAELPTYRAHCEQSMAHTAIAYAKTKHRHQLMACTSSIGPGATNFATAAGVAHVNRLPILFLPGDTFVSRAPDPVLQQVENFSEPTVSANDSLRPLSRYFDRIVKPEQLITSLPQAIAVLTDAENCGPVTLCLPQDVQAESYDFPMYFFEEKIHYQQRLGADNTQLKKIAETIKNSTQPIIVAGGGVLYSGAAETLNDFSKHFNIPVVETNAGKGALNFDNPRNIGSIGVTGTTPANVAVEQADLIITVGTRLSDFTTGSRMHISNGKPQININVGHFDANKHHALSLRSDAKRALEELKPRVEGWRTIDTWLPALGELKAEWERHVVNNILSPSATGLPSDAQVVNCVNEFVDMEKDIVVTAAGSMPAELLKLWKTKHRKGYHSEYGYSCMGYEIAAGIGVKMAAPDSDVYVLVGDGSYMMLNSEIATSVMLGQKMVVIVCDNRGFGCINRLQAHTGNAAFNNLLDDCESIDEGAPVIDFAAHAKAMGANSEKIQSLHALPEALGRAKISDKTYVIAMDTNPIDSSDGGVAWEVGIPSISSRKQVTDAQQAMLELKKNQPI